MHRNMGTNREKSRSRKWGRPALRREAREFELDVRVPIVRRNSLFRLFADPNPFVAQIIERPSAVVMPKFNATASTIAFARRDAEIAEKRSAPCLRVRSSG